MEVNLPFQRSDILNETRLHSKRNVHTRSRRMAQLVKFVAFALPVTLFFALLAHASIKAQQKKLSWGGATTLHSSGKVPQTPAPTLPK